MILNNLQYKTQMVKTENALLGRTDPIVKKLIHAISYHALEAPFPEGYKKILLGMGCFGGLNVYFGNFLACT